jgi:hypothetical protein
MNSQKETHALTMNDGERVDAKLFWWPTDVMFRPGQVRESFDSLVCSYMEAFHCGPGPSTDPHKITRAAQTAIHPRLPIEFCLVGHFARVLETL